MIENYFLKFETDLNMRQAKAWAAFEGMDCFSKIKCDFFQAAVVSILMYGCNTWTLTKRIEKKLDGNFTRVLRAILNKSCTATYHPSRKLSKLEEPDIWDTAGEVRTNS